MKKQSDNNGGNRPGSGRKDAVLARTPLEAAEALVNRKGAQKIIDLPKVEAIAKFCASEAEMAAELEISPAAWKIYKHRFPELQETIDRGRAKGTLRLRRMQYKAAMDGNASMLIWLGKQLLGQRDEQPEINIEGARQVTVRFIRAQPVETER